MFDIRADLNDSQYNAAIQSEGPVLVLAGAGSGKTRMLTYRVAHMIHQGIDPTSILAVTFTNKAAEEMKKRIKTLLGVEDIPVTVCTFHSFGAKILSKHWRQAGFKSRPTICDDEDSKKLIKDILGDMGIQKKEAAFTLSAISHAKDLLLMPWTPYGENDVRYTWNQQLKDAYWKYQKKLKSSCLVDFDDLITIPVLMLMDNPHILSGYQDRYRYLLIDEYQDTSHSQYVFTRFLAEKYRNICVVGDDYQSIYGFRGADITNILNFSKDYPEAKVFTMGENYRSTPVIVKAAQAVIQNNKEQMHKELISMDERPDPAKIRVIDSSTGYEEAEHIAKLIAQMADSGMPYSEIAVLYRLNYLSKNVEEALIRARIPYVIYGGVSFYQRKEIKDALAFLKVIDGEPDRIAFNRIINTPRRGMGKKAIEELNEFLDVNDGDLIEGALAWTGDKRPKLIEFCQKVIKARKDLLAGCDIGKIMEDFLFSENGIGYEDCIIEEADEDDEKQSVSRKNNIYELTGFMKQFYASHKDSDDIVKDFLEEISLYMESEKKQGDDDVEKVQLMTMHRSKGLEFDTVFLVGMDQEITPGSHYMNSEDDENNEKKVKNIEEERRLCYVGMTRAKNSLYMTSAQVRMCFGTETPMIPSQFISEIPEEYKELF